MPVYTRRQVVLLLLVVAAGALGLGIGHWRREHPGAVERLERLDRDPATLAAADATPPSREAPRPRESRPARETRTPREIQPPREIRPPRVPAQAREPTGTDDSAIANASTAPLDVNTATTDELARLPGVSRALAERIVRARDTGGPFTSADDLRRIRGIGAATLERLRPLLAITAE